MQAVKFFTVLLCSVIYSYVASDRKQKLKPSTTPGPGQYKPTAPQARTTTIKSRTKIFGCNVGEDSPGPNSYILPSTLIKKSHNVRSNGFGSQTSQANEEVCVLKFTGIQRLLLLHLLFASTDIMC